jgi:O-succinylbenzoic acid--CoA ligase
MAGYLDRPDATARALRDGWLHTGDIGELDAHGRLRVLDRRDDLIVSGGENVYPAEVEAALLAHPDVAEAGVVGLADAEWGQRVVAIVVPRRSPGEALAGELLAHCTGALARFKRPRELRFASALPRTASGKLQRGLLRQQVQEHDALHGSPIQPQGDG